MLDEKRVKLMTKMAIYEQKHGASDFRISAYYKKDYKSLNSILSWIFMTIGYFLLVGIACLAYMDEIIANITISGIVMLILSVLTVYIVLVIAYVIATNVFYDKKHHKARERVKSLNACLNRLSHMYERDEQ